MSGGRRDQSTVSKHLACLRDCGLVTSEPAGRASGVRLAQPALAGLGQPGVDVHRGRHRAVAGPGGRVDRAHRLGAGRTVEGLAGVIVIWRFTGPRTLSETAERRAQRGVAISFWLLAPYIAAESIRDLITGHH